MCRVVLLNQTQYVNHQLGAGLPSIPGRGIATPPDERWPPRESSNGGGGGGKTLSTRSWGGCVPEILFDRVTLALCGDLKHERDRRLQLADTASKHRAEFAFAQLENERSLTSLRDELRVAREIVDRSRDEIAALQTLVDDHHREHKALCEMLERKGVLHRKIQRTDGTA
uniref:Uncharacterized protein n=1 Tax=Peronospora matthiolae TaxID=2874970 RepID=A0AAV1V5P5_9STRA